MAIKEKKEIVDLETELLNKYNSLGLEIVIPDEETLSEEENGEETDN